MVEVVALLSGLVGDGEHVAGDLVASTVDGCFCERDDRHPVIGAELFSDRGEARQTPGCDVQVGDVLKRPVCIMAETLRA